MGVEIGEVVIEGSPTPAPAAPAAAKPASGASRPIDMDRLDYEARRRRHRAERLWAD